MKWFNLICYMYLSIFIYLPISHTISIPAIHPLQRFTKFEAHALNSNSSVVLENSIKQYGINQLANLHFIVKEKIFDFNVKLSVEKCKEYYIDCVNVVSYDILDACSKLIYVTYFYTVQNSERTVRNCPVYGEYKYENVSFDLDKFMSSFSNPLEKWWTYYWKTKMSLLDEKNNVIGHGALDFYIIQYRRRNH